MKYSLLIYSEEDVWSPDDLDVACDESVQPCHQFNDREQSLGAAPMHPASMANCVKVRGGQCTICDGPFAETKEQLAGYFLIDVANLEEAIAVAEKIPGTTRGTTDIRPIVELPGLP